MAVNVFSNKWEGLKWSGWIPLDAPHKVFRQITTEPGVYRIRAAELDFLIYIGQTGRNLRERINDLIIIDKLDFVTFYCNGAHGFFHKNILCRISISAQEVFSNT